MEILQIHWIPFIDYKTLSQCITVFTIQASQIGNQIWSDCFLSNLPCVIPSCIHIKPLLYQLYKAPFMNFPVPRKSQPHLQLNLYINNRKSQHWFQVLTMSAFSVLVLITDHQMVYLRKSSRTMITMTMAAILAYVDLRFR